MANFSYRAVDEDANILTGKLQARDENDLEQKLNVQGLTLIEGVKASILVLGKSKIAFTQQELANFSYFLHLIVSSGMPILSGLTDLMENKENEKVSLVAGLIHGKVDAGMSLSDAMQEYPGLFPEYYVQMIKAGEVSSNLEKMLADIMRYLEWQINFKKTVRSALAYPSIVLGAVFLLITALFTFVFPRLITILVGLRVELPLPTRVIMAGSGFFSAHFFAILMSVGAIFVATKLWLATYEGRRKRDSLLLRIPFLGNLIRKIDLSRYCKTMATLHAAGLNIVQTLTVSAAVVQNIIISEGLASVTESVVNGEGIAPSMQKTGVFPSLVVTMISIGEKTGNLDSAFQRVCDMFDREVPETLKKVLSYMEPLIIVMLGVIVLGVLLSVFLPIYKVVGGIRVR
jgi:type II secretory pathway component PulF